MRALVVLIALSLSACSFSVALYKDSKRAVLPISGKGGETFCWEGVGFPVGNQTVGVKPVGWGTHECGGAPTAD